MRDLTRRESLGLIAFLLVLTGCVGLFTWKELHASSANAKALSTAFPPPAESRLPTEGTAPSQDSKVNTSPAFAELVVHVAGSVKKPGLYHLPAGSRIDDALKMAGGPLPDANLNGLNLASHAEDGSQIYLPRKNEKASEEPQEAVVVHEAEKHDSPVESKSGRHASEGSGEHSSKPDKLSVAGQGTVNINKAGSEELQKLPGIGPSYAERILAYRKESGKFRTPEDLMQVSGIGEKKFARMKPFVRVR